MSWLDLTITELHRALVDKKTTPLELAEEAIGRAGKDTNNAFEYIMEKEALSIAEKLTEPEEDNVLWGIPFVIKDNFSTKDVPTTASSDILKGYVPLFDATAVDRLLKLRAVPIAKATLDELAMGGTGTSGHLGMTFNPYDPSHTRLVGGSSCGSAAAVASGIVPLSLASDTGDSVRKPASFAGLVGLKPTWGRISRYGLFAFTPSLDAVGFFTRSVEDAAHVLKALAGPDEKDATSSLEPVDDYASDIGKPVGGMKVAVFREILDSMSDRQVVSAFEKSVDGLRKRGVTVDFIEAGKDLLTTLFPTYFVISCAEATSNDANLDGVKFGPYYGGKTYREAMYQARTKGFGELIKRRFIIGSFSLMSENQHDLFLRAQKNRRRIVERINSILEDYDFIYAPAAPSVAPRKDAVMDKLGDEFLIADNHMVIANFAGLPSLTVPIGFEDGLPFGANLTGRAFREKDLFRMAGAVEDDAGLRNVIVGRKRS